MAPNIEQAQTSIRGHSPDGVLLDMNIHGQTTIAVAEELVSRAVPVLLVTGYSPRDGDLPVIKAAPRLQKPFDEEVWRAR
ncbi:MAG: hypothetical protein JOY71_21280 [Acetobacteraceae bacterium]|nr:hypothetical protein [Acetobacteraceae bacterium]